MYQARLVREKIERQNNFNQAGDTYRNFEAWERDELIFNLVDAISGCIQQIQDKMVDMFTQCDEDYGRRVREGLQKAASMSGNTGATSDRDEAIDQAEEISREAKPY